MAQEFQNLTASECFEEYATMLTPTSISRLILVYESDEYQATLPPGYEISWALGHGKPFKWMRKDPSTIGQTEGQGAGQGWDAWGYKVKYCLSEPVEEFCRLNFSIYLAIGVMGANIGKCLILTYLAMSLVERRLFVLGDAIQSFTAHPDSYSKGSCLASMRDFLASSNNDVWTGERVHISKQRRWRSSLTKTHTTTSALL